MDNFPPDIVELLHALTEHFKAILQSNLVGIYLHGSLAMGCFNPRSSDIDFLVVVRTRLSVAIKQQIIDFILALDQTAPAKGFEFSVVLLGELEHFSYPTPFELHFSNAWKAAYQTGSVDFEAQKTDADLAAHFVIVRTRGICLCGQAIEQVFPEVPGEYYLDSILRDAEDILQNTGQNPVYSILNLCRVLAFKREGLITSKTEGGAWGLKHLDQRYAPLITQALKQYQSTSYSHDIWSDDDLSAFAVYCGNLLGA